MGTPDTPLVGWLTRAVETGASDLHIVVGHRPTLRVHGELEAIEDAVLTRERAAQALLPFCPERVREIFEREHNADFALQLGSKTVSGTVTIMKRTTVADTFSKSDGGPPSK